MPERFGGDESGLFIAGPDRPDGDRVLLGGYVGPSMNPTLFEGDLLEIRPYESRPILSGDVIFFRNPEGNGYVVHRVAALSKSGVLARGDNNARADAHLLRPGDIVGRVVSARRGSRRRNIAGGRRGQIRGRLLLSLRAFQRGLSAVLHGPYRRIAEAGAVWKLVPKVRRPRCIETGPPGDARLSLVFLGKVIGHFEKQTGAWRIRRPFRIFVNEASLPRPPRP